MASDLTFRLFGEDVSASEALDKIGIKASDIAQAAAAAFTGIKLGEAFSQGLDAEASLDKFAAGFGGVGPISEKAGAAAAELFQQGFGESQDDILNGINAIGSQMVDLGSTSEEELLGLTRGAASVGEAFDVDIAEVARAAGQMMKNGMAKDGKEALDIIATGMANGANMGGDYIDVLSEYGDSFRNVGLDGQTATAMIASGMANGAFSADIAADSVREFGTRVLDGSAAASGAFSALGLDADAMTSAIAAGGPGAKDAMGQIMSALSSTTDPLARETAGVALFGGMWEDAGSQMILSMNPASQVLGDVAGAAQTMGDTLRDNSATKVAEASRTMDSFLQSAVNLPGPMGDIVAVGAAVGPQILTMGASFVTMGASIGPMFVSALGGVKNAFMAVNTVMKANPILLIVSLVAILVGVFITLWNTSDGFRNFFIGVWESISSAVSTAWNWIVGVVTGAWAAITAAFDAAVAWLVDTITGTWAAITGAFQAALDWVVTAWNNTWSWVTSFFQAIWNGLVAAVTAYINFWIGLFTGLFSWISDAWSNIWDWVSSFFKAVWSALTAVVQGYISFWVGVFTGLYNGIQTIFNNIKTFISGIWTTLSTTAATIWSSISSAITGAMSGAWSTLQSVWGGVVAWFTGIWNGIVNGAKNILGSIGSAVSGAFSGVAGVIKGAINGVISGVNFVISAINGISVTIPSWVPGVGGNTIGFNIGSIPKLAQGGIAMPRSGGYPAIIGDGGEPEAVVPLSKAADLGFGGGGGGINVVLPQNVLMVGSAAELGREIARYLAAAVQSGQIPRSILQGVG